MKLKIGYARVSTEEQAFNSHALEQQIARLEQAGAQEVYYDVVSGNNNDRENFNKLLKLIANNECDEVIATRWDRLTRNEENYILLKNLFRNSRVTLYLLDQGIVDLNTASGELTSDIQSIMSVHERRMLRERVLRGYEYRRQRKAASACAPFGYTVVLEKYQLNKRPLFCLITERPDNYLELSQESDINRLPSLSKADVAEDIIKTFLNFKNTKKTINYLYEKYGLIPIPGQNSSHFKGLVIPRSTTHLKDWITNPVLQGHTAYKKYHKKGCSKPNKEWDIHENTHPQEVLVSSAVLEEILDILAINRKEINQFPRNSYLRNLVFCAHCGHQCIYKTSKDRKYKYYGCRYSKQGCLNHKNISFYDIEEAIIQRIFTCAHDFFNKGDTTLDFSNSEELVKLKAKVFAIEAIPDFQSDPLLMTSREKNIREINLLTQSLKDKVFLNGTEQQMIRHSYARNLAFWYSLTESERSYIYHKLVNKVLISHELTISVHLNV